MTARDREEQGTVGPHWRGDGTLGPRRQAREPRALEQPWVYEASGGRSELRIAGAPLATFSRRLSATLIDGVVLSILLIVVAGLSSIGLDTDADGELIQERSGSAFLLVLLSYLVLFNALGWSPGKRAVGVRIVSPDGSRPGVGDGVSRALLSLLTPLLVGYFWAAFDGRGQTWHDMAASTYLVRAEPDREASETPDYVTWSERS
jgi:uncharacterized RDD family membrane protein YckC